MRTLVWRLVSPYDAYISHVIRLNDAIDRIHFLSDVALRYEAGIEGSGPLGPSGIDESERARVFRARLGAAAAAMTDEQFEEFLAMLGGGRVADLESNRARASERLSNTTRGLEEFFAIAGRELATLERRGYEPRRVDVARQLRENRLPPTSLAEYRHTLHELGLRIGKREQAAS
jgi:hypothetical protein